MIDVAVVGSGHNALIAACYLGRAGREVAVLERDVVIGGAVSTVERFPGHRVDRGSSAHLMIRHTGIVEELELEHFGLRYLDCDPWAFAPAPAPGGAPLVFRRDLDATCDSIAAACGAAHARAYRRFVAEWGPRSARVLRAFSGPATPVRFLRAFWGLEPARRSGV
ncbi:MAG: NAD(P)-binding protein, partial [Mycobacteriaceae bacterium]|nr:NAD(P)-binding protein [Mycobacteriaceae bacterium]